ncbi:putative serine protease HhoB precursor [Rubripirellula obstinata]|uniref:Putative serine protease HhoB n=2 Tax=Rubripirellula obstinata TaxID=406547 RepID=A0A5B1CMD5_9BACT|nr:trypsin-like peptidase domain-containing protein [Rubripirellula obstinata]KAA1262347.1 putative serine protease HhoB precursor [Rubripirellula obstinata]
MSRQTSQEDYNRTLVLILAGVVASLVFIAGVTAFAGLRYFRELKVAEEKPGMSQPISEVTDSTSPRSTTVPTVPTVPVSPPEPSIVEPEQPQRPEESRVRLVEDAEPNEPDAPEPHQRLDSSLQYAWKPNDKLVYDFNVTAEIGPKKLKYRGRNSIQATGKRPAVENVDDQTVEGSGTGFVIHPDGFVVTCAHVVKGARAIRATVGGRTVNAMVMKMDTENDLAILRLESKRLPYLKIADSDRVRLGQDVRAIGYPMMDVLGKTIKVTKGEVSGRGGPAGADGLQIDATINPGNSGGPLVDASGRLVGVTSSMLAGIGINEVGFAVPSNKVIDLARELSIAIEMQNESPTLSAPDIVDLVKPATVLLEVSVGPGGAGMESPHELKFTGNWYESTPPTMGSSMPTMPQHRHFNGKIQVTSSGESIQDDPKAMLPLLLGSISRVGIETLPDSAPGRDVSTQMIVIQSPERRQRRSQFDPYGFGSFGPRHRPPWMREREPAPDSTKALLGTESTTIVLGEPTSRGIKVQKSYSLTVGGESDQEPPLVISGSGDGWFDPVAGKMIEMKYTMSIKVNDENITLRIPVTMNYRLVDEQTLAKERIASQEREKARVEARAEAKANATPSTTKKSTFRSPVVTTSRTNQQLPIESVKNAPQSSNLRRFNFNK